MHYVKILGRRAQRLRIYFLLKPLFSHLILPFIASVAVYAGDFSKAAEERACSPEGVVKYFAMNSILRNELTNIECEFDSIEKNFYCIRVAEVQPVWDNFQKQSGTANREVAVADFLAQMKARIYKTTFSLRETGKEGNQVNYRMTFSGEKGGLPGGPAELGCVVRKSDIHYYPQVKFSPPYRISSAPFLVKGLLKEIIHAPR